MIDASYSILVVEDSETQALRLKAALETQGWKVTTAPTAQDALAHLKRDMPDLIIVDYHLPGSKGDQFCRTLRASAETRSVTILMFTEDDSQTIQLRSLAGGADDYISKSVDLDILLLRLRALLRKAKTRASIVGPTDAYFRQARLLAIDDSPTYRAFLCEELESEGYTVEVAKNGPEGLKRVATERFDGVLVDLMMPDMDGITVCMQLNQMRAGMDAPIVVLILTAKENKEDMTLGLEAGADDFVGKSSDKAVLKGRIRALLRRKFFQEENQRILNELKNKELEAARAKVAQEAAEARAALVDQLQKTAAELADANKELESFSYSVSHDLRAPLRHIDGFAQLLDKHAGASLDSTSRRYLATISSSAKRLGVLVDELLVFSRMGRTELMQTEVDMEALVAEVRRNLAPDLNGRQIDWKLSPLLKVRGDPAMLRQVWVNLIGNAVKYSRNREVACIEIFHEAADGEQVFTVRDNGAGFNMQYVDKLFGVFQRLHTQGEFEGTGIGLANVRRIVHRHGGRTWAESEVGKGATFHFSLPMRNPKTPGAPSS